MYFCGYPKVYQIDIPNYMNKLITKIVFVIALCCTLLCSITANSYKFPQAPQSWFKNQVTKGYGNAFDGEDFSTEGDSIDNEDFVTEEDSIAGGGDDFVTEGDSFTGGGDDFVTEGDSIGTEGDSIMITEFDSLKAYASERTLPLVNLTVDLKSVSKAKYIPASIEIFDYLKRTNPDTTTTTFPCKLKYRGATSLQYEKKSFAVKLVDSIGDDLDANLLNIREENSWILDAMAIDRLRMRNRVCFDVWNEMSKTPYETSFDGRNGTKGQFVEVFINGSYHGLYCLTDKIDRKLLGLKKFQTDSVGNNTIRGVLYKGNTWIDAIYLTRYRNDTLYGRDWNGWELQYPEDIPSYATWAPMMKLIDFCTTPKWSHYFSNYNNYFYTENLIDFAVFLLALNVGDVGYKNTFLSNVNVLQQDKFLLTPWDMDMSFGGYWDGSYHDEVASIDRYNKLAPYNRLLILDIDNFNAKMAQRWEECKHTVLGFDHVTQRIRDYADLFIDSGAWEREVLKWNNNPVPLQENIYDEIDYVVNWFERNHFAVDEIFNPNITAISQPEKNTFAVPMIYRVDGRTSNSNNLQQFTKGIYIYNGRKIFVK